MKEMHRVRIVGRDAEIFMPSLGMSSSLHLHMFINLEALQNPFISPPPFFKNGGVITLINNTIE